MDGLDEILMQSRAEMALITAFVAGANMVDEAMHITDFHDMPEEKK